MGGYGLYVWGSYGVTAALLLAEPWLVRRHLQRAPPRRRRPRHEEH